MRLILVYIMLLNINKIMDSQIYIIKSLEYIAHKLKENQMSLCTCQKKNIYLELARAVIDSRDGTAVAKLS